MHDLINHLSLAIGMKTDPNGLPKLIKIDRDWREFRSQFCTFEIVENRSSRTAVFLPANAFLRKCAKKS